MLNRMTSRSQRRCGFKMEKSQQQAGRVTFSPFVIIMSELLLHLARGVDWKCFSEGKCFQLHVSFKSSIPMYLLETFQETTFPFPSPFSNAILPARAARRPLHQPGLGKECDNEGAKVLALPILSYAAFQKKPLSPPPNPIPCIMKGFSTSSSMFRKICSL